MKIYHTETQADYDALMEELEAEGKNWWTGKKATENDIWNRFKSLTCVFVGKNINGFCYKEFYKEIAPDVPITKYKAKADEKMRFTKENVEKVIDDYFQEADFEPCGDLIAEIHNLDDTPEKVVVPKFVAEWIEQKKEKGTELQTILRCYRYFHDSVNYYPEANGEEAMQWYVDNPYKFIQAYENGYTIESEQLYYIPLPDLETPDGIQQVLSKPENGANYFACRPIEGLQQRYTKEEIAQVPERYKFYAKPIEEEE